MKNNDEQFWREFEARDRKNNPVEWAFHDRMMRQSENREAFGRNVVIKCFLALGLIALAIVITT